MVVLATIQFIESLHRPACIDSMIVILITFTRIICCKILYKIYTLQMFLFKKNGRKHAYLFLLCFSIQDKHDLDLSFVF